MKADELQRAADRNDMKGFYSGLKEAWGPQTKQLVHLKSSDGLENFTNSQSACDGMMEGIIIIIVYHIRRRRLLCAQNFVQTSLFIAKFISSNGDLAEVGEKSFTLPSPISFAIHKSSYDKVFQFPFS